MKPSDVALASVTCILVRSLSHCNAVAIHCSTRGLVSLDRRNLGLNRAVRAPRSALEGACSVSIACMRTCAVRTDAASRGSHQDPTQRSTRFTPASLRTWSTSMQMVSCILSGWSWRAQLGHTWNSLTHTKLSTDALGPEDCCRALDLGEQLDQLGRCFLGGIMPHGNAHLCHLCTILQVYRVETLLPDRRLRLFVDGVNEE